MQKILYKKTKTGAIQIWYQETDKNKFRTISGQLDGKKVTSNWTTCIPKNVGKINETTADEQCLLEVAANYSQKIKTGYVENVEHINNIRTFFEPMLAYSYKDKFNSSYVWFSQPKLDGIRCLVSDSGLQTRTGKGNIVSCPHVLEEMSTILKNFPDMIFDGELYNHRYKDNFNKLVSLVKKEKISEEDLKETTEKIEYHIYDCFSKSHKNMVFNKREELLNKVFDKYHGSKIIKVNTKLMTNQDEIDEYFAKYIEDGYEGQILRKSDSVYENKRSKFLLKRKDFIDEEFKLIDIVEGIGNRSEKAGNVICENKDGIVFKAGIKGSHEFASDLLLYKEHYIGGDVTVRFQNRTPGGVPRFGVAVAFYKGERDI